MITIKIFFGECTFMKGTRQKFDEIHDQIEGTLRKGLKEGEKEPEINLLTLDDDAYLTKFEKGEVYIEIGLTSEINYDSIEKNIISSIKSYLTKGTRVTFAQMEIKNNNIITI